MLRLLAQRTWPTPHTGARRHGYFAALPRREYLPIFWTDPQLERLRGTELEGRAQADRRGRLTVIRVGGFQRWCGLCATCPSPITHLVHCLRPLPLLLHSITCPSHHS